ncbi:MAG: hydrogenase iron-sulfur subunit [Clostridia bacterium]|nr:hydrogenase iron-sulfur subunit [Clostridia bacterium]
MQIENFNPVIIAFCCNWCSYAGADSAGTSRLPYPENVKIIKVPCSCRVNPNFILKAFQKGADGVIICGCHPGDCHYSTGNYFTRRRMQLLFSMLEFLGIEKERIRLEWVSASEGVKFAQIMNEFTDKVKTLGKNKKLEDLRCQK